MDSSELEPVGDLPNTLFNRARKGMLAGGGRFARILCKRWLMEVPDNPA